MVRLDAMHHTVRKYLGGGLSFIPLEDEKPRRILDVGCGSGAWAIQAALEFPQAEIIALDKTPLPARTLPENLHFTLANLQDPLPFENQTFDVVHARLVLCHVTNAREVLSRVAQLVKPGGLLLLEDSDVKNLSETGQPASLRACMSNMIAAWGRRGADLEVGSKLKEFVEETGRFEEVRIKKALCAFGAQNPDASETERELGREFQDSWTRSLPAMAMMPAASGLTEELVNEHLRELEEFGSSGCFGLYFCVARRSQ
ncbi:S-adenosyl-L-methionine-dependent methyltransferase [Roridomyces roridus]|uniref:S-adenosyl-L-methionine-dependent methyltransferase n=1 Tax=Roridomyces roridus TaxID=1738132 RepID=A0AAD7F9V6_9AGAR|nr:S-adenosyl-L-methionine-dependent methyltransferase [Roridomyces roridus]